MIQVPTFTIHVDVAPVV
jgi:hypothetical protein